MTAQSNPSHTPNPEPATGRPRRRWLPVAAVALAAALTGAAATSAVGQYGPPWGGHGFMHGPGFMRGPLSPADIEERVDRGIRHAAIEIDATPEQQEKLRTIARGAVKDLLPMREKAQAARAKVAELLTQPKIDRTAIEAFRAEQVGLVDAASKRFAQAVIDAAEVLTPEQRQKAHELLQWRRGGPWGRWHRG
jgi:Spy/CpxP family protein refolding chaperone